MDFRFWRKKIIPQIERLNSLDKMLFEDQKQEPLPKNFTMPQQVEIKESEKKGIDQSQVYNYDNTYAENLYNRNLIIEKEHRQRRFTESIFPINNPDTGTLWDDRFYTQLNQASLIDLDPRSSQIAQRLCLLEYRKNVRCWGAVELINEFCVGDGVKINAMSNRVQRIIDDHWDINEWDEKLPERVRSLVLFGEQLFPAFVSGEGMVRISSITPLRILAVTRNSEDAESMENVKVNLSTSDHVEAGQRIYSYRIIRPRALRAPMEGDAFYFAANRVGGGSRGIPDFLASIDWFEGFDNFSFALMERMNLAMSIVYDLTFMEMDDKGVKKKLQEFARALRSGDIYGHNDKVKLDMKAPQLGAIDASHASQILKGQIQAGTRWPGLYFGDASELSRSSASEMSIPVAKMVGAKQVFIRRMIERVLDYQLEQSILAGQLSPTDDFRYEVEMPNVFLRDMQQVSKSLIDLTVSLQAGTQEKWINTAQAGRIYRTALGQLGININDPPVELTTQAKPESEEFPVSGDYQSILDRKRKI